MRAEVPREAGLPGPRQVGPVEAEKWPEVTFGLRWTLVWTQKGHLRDWLSAKYSNSVQVIVSSTR